MTNKKETKTEKIVDVTPEEKDRFIEDLVFKGQATYGKSVLNGKLKILFKSLRTGDQMEIERIMPTVDGSATYVMHVYSVKLVAVSLQHYNDTDMTEWHVDQKEKFIKELPNTIQDVLINTYNEFQDKLHAVSVGTELDKSFFEIPPTS